MESLRLTLYASLTIIWGIGHAAAGGNPWAKSFDADALATYLATGELRVVVAGPDKNAKSATRALMKALRATDKTQLVMNATGLGKLESLGDAEIAAKATGLPVDLIAVVRVFDGSPSTAVVTFLNKEGETQSAFNVVAGEPLQQNTLATRGVTAATSNTVRDVLGERGVDENKSPSQLEFEERALWLQGMVAVSGNQYGVWSTSWEEPRQGKYGKPIKWGDFFTLVERPELHEQWQEAEAYGSMRALGVTAMTLGAIAGSVFGTLWLVDSIGSSYDNEPKSRKWPLLTLVSGAMTVGGIALAAGGPSYPKVPGHEVREMVDGYNGRLKKELGMASAAGGVEEARGTTIALTPIISERAAGAMLTLAF